MKRLAPVMLITLFAVGCGGTQAYYPAADVRYGSPREDQDAVARDASAPAIDHSPAWRAFETAHAAEHVVKAGDTTSQIAQARLGTVRNLPLLLLANPEIADVHKIAAEDVLVLPTPGYFAGPFLVDGEKAAGMRLLRWSAAERRAFLGVEVRDTGPAGLDRFVLLEVHAGRSRVLFNSSNYGWRGRANGGYRCGWEWRIIDLDGDGGLDLLASGGGRGLYAYAFHRRGEKYDRHVLVEGLAGGQFPPGKKGFRAGSFTFVGNRTRSSSVGRSLQPVRVTLRWTGSAFARREVESGRAHFVPARAARKGELK